MLRRVWVSLLAVFAVVGVGFEVRAEEAGFAIQTNGALFDALCQDRSPCRVQRVYSAGKSAKGVPLQVAEVGLHNQPDDGHSQPYGALDEKGEEILCYTNEFWVYEDSTPPRTEKLFETCNDGYGASGVGEDTVTVSDNRVELSTHGGSAERWTEGKVWQLSPMRILEVSNSGYSIYRMESTSSSAWNWQTFSGKDEWFLQSCDASGNYTEEGALHSFIASPIPSIAALPGDKDWKETGLGECALRVDSKGDGGFITYGKPGDAGDASMRALLINKQVLLLEIQDDAFTNGDAAKWIHDDHVELWIAPEGSRGYPDCLVSKASPVHQWGIMLDGTVHAAHGKPKDKLGVEVHKVNDTTVRLRVTLPAAFDAISVVYSDSDDGKTQERLIGSSKVVFGETQSLGSAQVISDEAPVACKLVGGALKTTYK